MPSDIQIEHIIFAKTPPAWHPYLRLARLDRPIGIWLLLFPCWWGIVLAGQGPLNMGPRAWIDMVLFAVGAAVMRGAGCVVNDLWDMKLDAQVERTKSRPLPSGEITRAQALRFLAGLLGAGFLILICLPPLAIGLGVFSLLLVIAYPLMKRVTWWPQAFLGLTFNWGALMGWAAVTRHIELPALALYVGGFFWTLAYDTIYAHQDKEDDVRVGIRSTALLFGQESRRAVSIFYALAVVFIFAAKCLALPSILTPMLLIPLGWQAWRLVRGWNMDDPRNCLNTFKSNVIFGWLALLMLAF